MNKLAKTAVSKFINIGTPLLLMGAMWLLLWVFPWRQAYLYDPHWGHNYAESLAFLCVALAYFNRRLLSDALALLAAVLIIPASLELLPHTATAAAGAALALLIILDMVLERGRKDDLGQPANRRLAFWLKRHLLLLAFILLGHLALLYFFVRLPAGTYETDLVTKVYDAMLIVFIILAILEGVVQRLWGARTSLVGFFWGMLTIIIALIILFHQPETRMFLGTSLVVSSLAIASLVITRQTATSDT